MYQWACPYGAQHGLGPVDDDAQIVASVSRPERFFEAGAPDALRVAMGGCALPVGVMGNSFGTDHR